MIGLFKEQSVLFVFERWEHEPGEGRFNAGILQLYDCTLKKPMGKFKAGSFIPVIRIDFEPSGTVQLFDGEGKLLYEFSYSCLQYDLEGKRIVSGSEVG